MLNDLFLCLFNDTISSTEIVTMNENGTMIKDVVFVCFDYHPDTSTPQVSIQLPAPRTQNNTPSGLVFMILQHLNQ